MAAKTPQSESTRGTGRPPHRRREITGILLLAGGLFTGLALVSRQSGDPMMGPGGEAIAGAFYAAAGLGAYLIVAGMLVAAVRCFRGRRLASTRR